MCIYILAPKTFNEVSNASSFGWFSSHSSVGLSYVERPILGGNPKAHQILLKCAAHFTEMRCAFHVLVHFTEMHFTEMRCTFHWNALVNMLFTVKCAEKHFSEMLKNIYSVKCAVHFSEMRSEMQWHFSEMCSEMHSSISVIMRSEMLSHLHFTEMH